MANTIVSLNNYSDDANIKQYISDVIMPRVFHNIPLNILNTGEFSVINEYISQTTEQLAFTSSFFFNESFITKAILPESIYAEAALFNIGYSFATPSSCNFLLELKIADIKNNAVYNSDNGLNEFTLDKNTKFNLNNGSVYSLDYDILIQYKDITVNNESSTLPAWNIQYTNMDETNYVAKNKNTYITYRVTDVWLCLFIQASEYERETHTIVNNTTNNIPNADEIITCNNHIAGFDVEYINSDGNSQFLDRDHILALQARVNDTNPYIHYIMDNSQTIRFMFQLNGSKYFVPATNSSFKITIYTCHGEAANFTAFKNDEQPLVITSSTKYPNNANVTKAAFVISGSLGGVNIGTVESVRRKTTEAYNTANVISTDHDIDEWFQSFFFDNVLYPYFFKRRDDPSGKLWSGYLALKDTDDYIFRTNTLHCKIPYELLYANNDNTVTDNEIIIPPGWIWIYNNQNRYTVRPYTVSNSTTIETAKTLYSIQEDFVFSNPFGIRIQKSPFAIGYFNPWINESYTATHLSLSITDNQVVDNNLEDASYVYHASPLTINIVRTYVDDYYKITAWIVPSSNTWIDNSELVTYVKQNATVPIFVNNMWNYFKQPLDLYSANIPILPLTHEETYISFTPENTYFCVRNKNKTDDSTWTLTDIWIDDYSDIEMKRVYIPITGDITRLYGTDEIWGDNGLWVGNSVFVSGDTTIGIYPVLTTESRISFNKLGSQNYYELRLNETETTGTISKIIVGEATDTELTKFDELKLVKIGKSYSNIYLNVYYSDGTTANLTITNASNVYMPYEYTETENGYEFDLSEVEADGIILYAEMKPEPDSGAIDYYRIPLSAISENEALFFIKNNLLPLELNNMRVLLHAMVNGSESGYVEMQPVKKEDDGSYKFEVNMIPLTELIDLDNRISIASTNNGGGNWVASNDNSVVNLDALEPELIMSILIRSQDSSRDSVISIGDSYTGFRLVDKYQIDDVEFVQELKDMRSVVNFEDSSQPTTVQKSLYNEFLSLNEYDETTQNTIYTIKEYSYRRMNSIQITDLTFSQIQTITADVKTSLTSLINQAIANNVETSTLFDDLLNDLDTIISFDTHNGSSDVLDWIGIWNACNSYVMNVNTSFDSVNINGGLEIQLVPMVEYSTMTSDRFESFISAFTTVHEAIEPVIFERLEGNNFLDVKMIATYGLPHSYSSDIDIDLDEVYWPDLHIQIEFDVKLYNKGLATNTISELKNIIKSYFNRITSVHTPKDAISMDNNIYISHVIQQMEEHANVAYMKFKGWYTDEKNNVAGNYMDANVQAIVQKWETIDDFPTKKLESYTPEMFIVDSDDIVINII